jgi:hypothetical protein
MSVTLAIEVLDSDLRQAIVTPRLSSAVRMLGRRVLAPIPIAPDPTELPFDFTGNRGTTSGIRARSDVALEAA